MRAGFWLLGLLAAVAVGCGGNSDNSAPSSRPPDTRPATARPASGPVATMDPSSGRPGTEVVVMGTGWPAGSTITIAGTASGASSSQPYATATASNDGSFTARFRLDRAPAGGNLNPGRLNLVAAAGSTSVTLGFDVLPPLPGGPVGGGPGG